MSTLIAATVTGVAVFTGGTDGDDPYRARWSDRSQIAIDADMSGHAAPEIGNVPDLLVTSAHAPNTVITFSDTGSTGDLPNMTITVDRPRHAPKADGSPYTSGAQRAPESNIE